LFPGWPVSTTTIGTVNGNHNIFKSDFGYFIAAALVEMACILLVAPTYWGVSKLVGQNGNSNHVVAAWSSTRSELTSLLYVLLSKTFANPFAHYF
jgi:hypothetical protein